MSGTRGPIDGVAAVLGAAAPLAAPRERAHYPAPWPDNSRNGGRRRLGMVAGFASESLADFSRNLRPGQATQLFGGYVFRLGFLDGVKGLIFHTLQRFWFRFLIDAKIWELQRTQAHMLEPGPPDTTGWGVSASQPRLSTSRAPGPDPDCRSARL